MKRLAFDSLSGRKSSMTLINSTELLDQKTPTTPIQKPRMATLQTLEAKMANIEESLSMSVAARRRKGTSLGSVSSRSSPKLDTILSTPNNNNTITQTHPKDNQNEREMIMQNLRVQLGIEKQSSGRSSSASVSGPPLENNGERPVNEQKLSRLKNDAENKKNAIRNLKCALQKLDMNPTLDIDSRIRQAELEYALGREELQLLSIVEEARAIQVRLEKENSKCDVTSIASQMRNGYQMTLHVVKASTGRWNASQKHDCGEGFFVDWVMDGEELQRGDRIIELNGRILSGRNKDELQKLCANTTKCDLVVIRKRSISKVNLVPMPSHHHPNIQQLQQTQADNLRLQHRISYLEEQVKELLEVQKDKSSPAMSNGSQRSGTHITSISISSSPSDHDEDRPMIYQRGSYVTTIVGGKPQDTPHKTVTASTPQVQKSSSTTNINGHHNRETPKQIDKNGSAKTVKNLSSSMSRISISTDLHVQKQRRERERRERERYYNNKNISKSAQQQSLTKNSITASMNQIENSYSKRNKNGHDERSIKSLDFESDTGQNNNYDDYASEPVPAPKIRPTPPKKPLRLSLQRARSLQAVCGIDSHTNTPLMDTINLSNNDKKRAIKRIYRGEMTNGYSRSIELSPKYLEKYV